MNTIPHKIEICAEIITNHDKTQFYLNKTNQTVNYYNKLVECSCDNNRICLCNLRNNQIMEEEDHSKTRSKRKKFDKSNQELRRVKCNHCFNVMPWIKYWSYEHECFFKLASYSYEKEDDDLDTFLPWHKNSHGWYHNCKKCNGMFEVSQWKYKKIWYHTACTDDDKFFFENLKKIDVIKHKGTHALMC